MTDTISGILIILIGLFSMFGAVLNWRIVNRPGKLLNLLLGDTTARIVYGAVGFLLIVLGIGRLAGINWLGQ